MSLGLDRFSKHRVAWLTLLVIMGGVSSVCAKPVSVCPLRDHAKVQQIDIFDGTPQGLAFLAPDDPDKAPDVYQVGAIFKRGGRVTVRCHYDDGSFRDTALNAHNRTCRYRETRGEASPELVCQ